MVNDDEEENMVNDDEENNMVEEKNMVNEDEEKNMVNEDEENGYDFYTRSYVYLYYFFDGRLGNDLKNR